MIRTTLLMLLVAYLSAYAWRNYFVSLCGAILLMAVVEHPDFPKGIAGIQGLNPWNFLILMVFLAWRSTRHLDPGRPPGVSWDMPPIANRLLVGYFVVVTIGVLRLVVHHPNYPDYSFMSVVSEDFINCVKWVVPGLLLFDACRTPQRVTIALFVVLALYFFLAIQVIRWMPLSYAVSGSDLSYRASKITQNEIGYNRVTLSMMLAGASWAMLALVPLARNYYYKAGLVGAAGVVALGQALTGGRTGYVTWAAVGLTICVLRWRKLLPLIPIGAIAIGVALPGVRERMLQGFGSSSGPITVATSNYELTSGRNLAWPRVIEKATEAPIFGFGREAMVTTGLKDELWEDLRESFPHPHQAYLEILLDNGILGFLIIIPFYLFVLKRSLGLVRDRSDPLFSSVGIAAFALISALMIGSFGGQTFYPREGAVGMWAAIGIMLRVSVEIEKSQGELYDGAPPNTIGGALS